MPVGDHMRAPGPASTPYRPKRKGRIKKIPSNLAPMLRRGATPAEGRGVPMPPMVRNPRRSGFPARKNRNRRYFGRGG